MTIIDANVLLYACNADAPQHRAASQWLNKLLTSGETIGLPWIYSAMGPVVTDAVLAALGIEYGASLFSADQVFRRFPDLRWIDPLGR